MWFYLFWGKILMIWLLHDANIYFVDAKRLTIENNDMPIYAGSLAEVKHNTFKNRKL